MFDTFLIIDDGSTDRSLDIVRELAPEWKIVKSRREDFNALEVDLEVIDWEKTLPCSSLDWKLTLNATEWILHPDWKKHLQEQIQNNPGVRAFGFPSYCLIDSGDTSGLPVDIKHHFWGYRSVDLPPHVQAMPRFHRFVHNLEHGNYSPGRHSVQGLAGGEDKLLEWEDNMSLIHWNLAPWPACIHRKLGILPRIPVSDIRESKGVQHYFFNGLTDLEAMHSRHLSVSQDLRNYEDFDRARKERLHRNT
jgi:glycosyltransferase involved in cell wall biosynthesis